MRLKLNWDSVGILTSLLCAIHCLLLPLLLTSLPIFGFDLIHDPIFEWSMIALAIAIGIYALSHGYKKHHHNKLPIYLFCAGAVLLILKQFYHGNTFLLIAAVIFIIAAHVQNYRLCRKTSCSAPHHTH
jgi:hypothetical protein